MNNFKNVTEFLEYEVQFLKGKLDSNTLTAEQEVKALNLVREMELAILTLESSVELLNLGSVNAITQLQK